MLPVVLAVVLATAVASMPPVAAAQTRGPASPGGAPSTAVPRPSGGSDLSVAVVAGFFGALAASGAAMIVRRRRRRPAAPDSAAFGNVRAPGDPQRSPDARPAPRPAPPPRAPRVTGMTPMAGDPTRRVAPGSRRPPARGPRG